MFTNCRFLDNFDYICAQNAQCWARITKSDMEIQRYNRLKAAIERVQNEVHFNSAERTGSTAGQDSTGRERKNWYVALRADVPQHQYSFTLDDQQGATISGTTLRDCTSPRRGCEGIVSVVETRQ